MVITANKHPKRQVFFSFHYEDNWRVQQIRNIGAIDGNEPLSPNKWEDVKRSGDISIKKWINNQLHMRSCTVVFIGEKTAHRKWVKYEIEQSWKMKKGIIGIYIHNLKDNNGDKSKKGENPFHGICIDGIDLEKAVSIYDPSDFKEIANNIEKWVEKEIKDQS